MSTPAQPTPPRLEVVVRQAADVVGAQEGGADRLHLATPADRSPEPRLVSEVCRDADVPVRVLLRLSDGLSTTGGELARLIGLGRSFVAVGAEGVSFGFLDGDLELDLEVCTALADGLEGVPWTFDRAAFDAALDPRRAWRQVTGPAAPPGLDGVVSAGSVRGLATGVEELLDRVGSSPAAAALLVAGGGLAGEHVPWLLRAGVRTFRVGTSVRPGGSPKAYVDSRLVRSWRTLLDDGSAHLAEVAGA